VRFSLVAPLTSTTPNEAVTRSSFSWLRTVVVSCTACSASTRPVPWRSRVAFCVSVALCWTSEVAVFMRAALTSGALQPGWASNASAATPATCGVAIEVPLIDMRPSPVPFAAEMTFTPGPAMSGLTMSSTEPCTPRLVNGARVLVVSCPRAMS
jgi:hypothetical protein